MARDAAAASNRERENSPAAAGVFCFDSGNTGGEARVLGWRQGGVRRQGPGWGLIKGRRPGLGVRVQEVRGEIFGGDCGEALRCGGEGAGRRDRGERAEARGAGDAGLLRVCALGRARSRGGLKRSRPGGARASWAEVGPREGRGRPGPRWAGPGLLLGWVLVVGLGLGWVEGLGFLFPILLLSKSKSNKV